MERLSEAGPGAGIPGMPPGMPGMFNPFGGGPPGGFPGLPDAGGDDLPMTLREMALREQGMEGYGRPGMGGGMPPWARFGREPEGYVESETCVSRPLWLSPSVINISTCHHRSFFSHKS